ncbi:hypothetical protein ACF0H5_019337 [Mactra antiquata]
MIINVVEVRSTENATFVCNVSLTTTLTRWTYLTGSTGTSLMRFQNRICTVSPSDSFLSESGRFSYTCNSTVHQVTIHPYTSVSWNNYILGCRDALQSDGAGSTWMIRKVSDGDQCNCGPTITFNIKEVTEGDNVLFVCSVSSNVTYINWNVNVGSNTAAMGVQNGRCNIAPDTSFLNNTSEYIYTCNNTVYQVTRLNVQRSEHNDIYMCTPPTQLEGEGSNWIIKVRAPVKSVTMTPTDNEDDIIEHTAVEFTCTTSTARPPASVYWYVHPNGNSNNITQITEHISTMTDYNELSVITSTLRFVPARQHNNMNILCSANNSVNTSPVTSNKKLLNVLYNADDPYIIQGSEYRVIENTPGTLSCSVKSGNPTPTLSWSCNNFTPTNQSTIRSNGNVTTTLRWTALRRHRGKCTCTSQQTGFQNESLHISLVVLYKSVVLSFVINGLTDEDVTVNEGTALTFRCVTDGNPIPTMTLSHGTNILKSINSHHLEYTLSSASCQDIGTYSCATQNELNANTGVSNVDIFVQCTPMFTVSSERNKVSGIGEKVNITCDVISYPLPVFTWWQNVNGQWKQIQRTERMLVESSGLQSTLTIIKVDYEDFTSYKVIAENNIGNVELVYSLSHNGSPDVPTQLRYFEDLSTSSSIQLAWNPGYNGGSTQIFYIQYKPKDENSWKYKTVYDDGEHTRTFDLTGLKDNMYYYVVLLASNKNGNSTESQLLVANTKEVEKTQTCNCGPMVGGIVGGAIILAVICTICGIIIGRNMSRKGCMKQSNTEHKTER